MKRNWLQKQQKEKRRREKEKKGREKIKKEKTKAENKRKQTKQKGKAPKKLKLTPPKTLTEQTTHCSFCEALWCEDDPEIWIECEACACWTHASCAGYESNDDLEDETFICCM